MVDGEKLAIDSVIIHVTWCSWKSYNPWEMCELSLTDRFPHSEMSRRSTDLNDYASILSDLKMYEQQKRLTQSSLFRFIHFREMSKWFKIGILLLYRRDAKEWLGADYYLW